MSANIYQTTKSSIQVDNHFQVVSISTLTKIFIAQREKGVILRIHKTGATLYGMLVVDFDHRRYQRKSVRCLGDLSKDRLLLG
jgi:hypothetical protein